MRVSWLAGLLPLAFATLVLPAPVTPVASQHGTSPHEPIEIRSDSEFLLPTSGVRGGTGTASDPFVISGWTIRTHGQMAPSVPGPYGILIVGTTSHVVIKDCEIETSEPAHTGVRIDDADRVRVEGARVWGNGLGIRFDRATDSVIVSSSISSGTGGIQVYSSARIRIAENNVADNGHDGIHVVKSASIEISHNSVVNNSRRDSSDDGQPLSADGIRVDESRSVQIEDNAVAGNEGSGIAIGGGTEIRVLRNRVGWEGTRAPLAGIQTGAVDALLADNVVVNAQVAGIRVGAGTNVTVQENRLGQTKAVRMKAGIEIDDVQAVRILSNQVEGASEHGLQARNATRLEGRLNRFEGNGAAGLSLADVGESEFFDESLVGNHHFGALLQSSSNVRLYNITASGAVGRAALYVERSRSVQIEGGVFASSLRGVELGESHGVRVSNATIKDGVDEDYSGILVDGDDNVIENNQVRDGRGVGIWLWRGAERNLIRNNTLSNNAKGDIVSAPAPSQNAILDNQGSVHYSSTGAGSPNPSWLVVLAFMATSACMRRHRGRSRAKPRRS